MAAGSGGCLHLCLHEACTRITTLGTEGGYNCTSGKLNHPRDFLNPDSQVSWEVPESRLLACTIILDINGMVTRRRPPKPKIPCQEFILKVPREREAEKKINKEHCGDIFPGTTRAPNIGNSGLEGSAGLQFSQPQVRVFVRMPLSPPYPSDYL